MKTITQRGVLLLMLALLTDTGRCLAAEAGPAEASNAAAVRQPAVLFALQAKPWINQYVEGTVAEWAAAARKRGYDFLVFTESSPPLTEERWKQLDEQCRQASNAEFLCVPGIDYRDSRDNRYVSFAFPLWPKEEWLSKDRDRIANLSGFYFDNDWAPLAVVDTMHNPIGPWFLKFYGVLSVFSYRVEASQCRCTDDALDSYLRLMGKRPSGKGIAVTDAELPLGGYAALYPDFYGSGCVFSLASEVVPPSRRPSVEGTRRLPSPQPFGNGHAADEMLLRRQVEK